LWGVRPKLKGPSFQAWLLSNPELLKKLPRTEGQDPGAAGVRRMRVMANVLAELANR
jgi:hypothetical protein